MLIQHTLISGTATADGAATALRVGRNVTVMLQAYLDGAGVSATCTVEARMNGGPWNEVTSFALAGASDHAEYILDNEPWYELRGRITAIGVTTTATVVMGS